MMPKQNRVSPFSEFEATSARGLLMGNWGILHDDQGVLGPSRWGHKNWVACTLSFKNRRRRIMAPGKYTELFFCDEAVSLAAGHRPCAECRRSDYNWFMTAWQTAFALSALPKAPEVDRALHSARVDRDKRQIRVSGPIGGLPDGSMICLPDAPRAAWLTWKGHLHRWSHEGYTERRTLPVGADAIILTPEPSLRVLAAGYLPSVHPSAGA
jgi:hypothetical protein